MFRTTVLFLFLGLLIGGCKNDLRLNAPYKEMPSVYAVLSPQEKIHVIRINKVFLGEGDANAMAKVADSVNYPQGQLEVTLTRFLFGVQVPAAKNDSMVVRFRDDSTVTTAGGSFSTFQRLYVSKDVLFTSGEYRLTIKNKHTGNVFTAKANSLDSIRGAFRPLSVPYYPYNVLTTPLDEYIQYEAKNGTVRFTPNEGKIYQLRIRTHYFDSVGSSKTYDYLDYDFTSRDERTRTIQGNMSYIVYDFAMQDYWDAMGKALREKNPTDQVYGRKVFKIEYIVYASTQEYLDYLQYASPSFGLTQNTAIYSNFDGEAAIGLFTFRSRFSVVKQPSSPMINEFSRNPLTCGYRFVTDEMPSRILSCQP